MEVNHGFRIINAPAIDAEWEEERSNGFSLPWEVQQVCDPTKAFRASS